MSWELFKLFVLNPLWGAIGLTGVVAIGCFVTWWFTRISWFGFAGVAALACGTFYWWAFRAGESHAYQLVAARDRAAVHRVERARSSVERCMDGGGEWDVSTGSCNAK